MVELFIVLLIGILTLTFPPFVSAQAPAVEVKVFVREGCQHCKDEGAFLTKLDAQRDDVSITYFRLEDNDGRKMWDDFTARLGISKVTPITVVGTRYLIGFDKPETTGKEIVVLIEKAKSEKAVTDLSNVKEDGKFAENSTCDESGLAPCTNEPSVALTLPVMGTIDSKQYPLLILSAMLGFFDGFNPCAMWVLITFLMILIQVGNRRKMLLFAGTFILAEAVMYTLILTVWYKTWDFVRLDSIVTPAVGLVAIGGGIFFLREWHRKEIECKVMDLSKRHDTKQKLHNLAAGRFTVATFLSILGIAFSVNVIEFACSIGIPQAFTKILEINRLSSVQNAALIAIYILFYMFDDFLVFGLALWGAEKLHLTNTYARWSNLIGGMVMLLLGGMLLWNPALLLFR